jgi:SAM-dependent methyltransferase
VTREDRDRWDARHRAAAGAGAPAVPAPPDALRGREHLLPAGGRALDVACGRGTVAVWLAERGFGVDAVDVSESALAAGAALAADHGVSEQVRWWAHDLDEGLPEGCAGPYDVVVCQRFRDPALYPLLAHGLAPGGLLAVTVLSVVEDEGGPFRADAGELLAAFDGLTRLDHTERDGEARLLARRP